MEPARVDWVVQWAANRKAHRKPNNNRPAANSRSFAFGTPPDYLQGRLEGVPRVVDVSLAADRASELPDVLTALKAIPANIDRTKWWEIGAALHWWDPSDFGLEVWKRWSSTSDNPAHQDWK